MPGKPTARDGAKKWQRKELPGGGHVEYAIVRKPAPQKKTAKKGT